ncbi:DNA (cytosine-5)-methyltransferase 1 [Paenibacillus sophorae]|uniref:Cytosine-specific methyltransferase n=1 Tax=Paenibacillus sophorae TaxID=1333845 RepID=A0A1H8TIE1_9BACL|nr:DNA cytosine methyltransferase [Paenibacillus sophorae]QWU16226.1 DNA cytosine methyltransferase [Paenibacillus sophorae]SEO90647.1 DNA (cytosine-5)-methyltransferase 1 [Paenibacillus sophorae]
MSKRTYTTIDLFSGAGGLSLGFNSTGRYKSVFAVEFDQAAAHTYARNFSHQIIENDLLQNELLDIDVPGYVFNDDIRKLGTVNLKADIIIGGPPCQGFSPLGKISPRDEHLRMNQLWQEYMRVVAQVKPLAFVIENVPELLKSREAVAIRTLAERMGYTVNYGELKAVEFGVPQRRVRAFIVGILGPHHPALPMPGTSRRSVRDAISDLPLYPETTNLDPLPTAGTDELQNLHFGRNPTEVSLKRYRLIPPGGNRFDLMRQAPEITPRCWLEKPTGTTDVFGRLRWDEPAYTIRTEFFKPEKGCYLHPEAHRPLTHREAARLQTFRDDFIFVGSKTQIAKQIGNAVPPMLAQVLAQNLARQLDRLSSEELKKDRHRMTTTAFNVLLEQVVTEIYSKPSVQVEVEEPSEYSQLLQSIAR